MRRQLLGTLALLVCASLLLWSTDFSRYVATTGENAWENYLEAPPTLGGAVNTTDIQLLQYGNYSAGMFAMRFNNVTIPQGATITAAKITAWQTQTSVNNSWNSLAGTISGEDVDDAAAFGTSDGALSTLTKTTATVAWTAATIPQGYHDSPSIIDIVAEITSRAGWASGNDMVLFVVNTSSQTGFYRFGVVADGASYAAQLVVSYTAAGGTRRRVIMVQ